MDNKKKDTSSLVEGWLNEIKQKLDFPDEEELDEIRPDEGALSSSKLKHPDDMELERIVQETIEENWGDEFGLQTESSAQQAAVPEAEAPAEPKEATPAELAEPEKAESFMEKIRPKGKKGYGLLGIPHILSTVIWICIILTIGITLGRTVWVCAADVLALGKEGKNVTISIDSDDNMSDIALKLQEAGLIRYPRLFEMFTELTGKGTNILNGDITFSEKTVYDYNALVNAMSFRGVSSVTIDVMIPEGYSCAQIFALLEEKGVCKAADLEEYAANGELDEYWFLEDVERGHKYCLEGFLFPDTYEFYLRDEPKNVLEKFLNTFELRFSDRMVDKFMALNSSTGLNLTVRDVVIMASIIEKEKATDLEGYTISSVFYNRLTHSADYPFLNSDATKLYATEYYYKGENMTSAQIDASPYNTYTHKGLPGGAIANPGLASLDAALEPEETDYYFFIYDKSAGYHRFSKNLAEHTEWANKLGY